MTAQADQALPMAADRIRRTADGLASSRVSLGALVDRLGPSGAGLCLLALGLTTLVPGIAPLFGVALCTVSLGMVLGHGRPYLPGIIRRRQLDGSLLRRGLHRLVPVVAWIERRLRPRAAGWLDGAGPRLAGLAGVVNGVLIVLPIPFGNTAPAVAVLVLALGLVTGDGLAAAAGLALTVVAVAIDVGLVTLGFAAVTGLFHSIF